MTTFLPKITNKELDFGSPTNTARWHDFLSQNEGKTVRITKPKENRSLSQNNLYWFFLEIISSETGNDATEMHEFFKKRFLPKRTAIIKGKNNDHEVEIYQSTTQLSKSDFGDYLDRISSLTGVQIPDPSLLAGYLEN